MRIHFVGSFLAACVLTWAASANTFVIEAEDFDFGGGQHVLEASLMPYYGGMFEGLGAIHEVDYFRTRSEFFEQYRFGEDPNTTIIFSNMPEAVDRVNWISSMNFLVLMEPAEWFNYTRTFPAGNYRIYAGLSDGALDPVPNKIRAELGVVTSGHGTTEQTVQTLGEFIGTGTGTWQIPSQVMLTANGAPVVVSLDGVSTLRITAEYGHPDYLLLVPEHAPGPTISVNKTDLAAGESLILNSSVIGAGPFAYQWRLNGVDIPGATGATYEVAATGMEHSGRYSLYVSNEHGAMVSTAVSIRVSFPINIGDTVSPGFPFEGAGVLAGDQVEWDVYTFHGNLGDTVFIEALQGDCWGGLRFQLIAPDDQVLIASPFGFCAAFEPYRGIVLPQTGTYEIVVSTDWFLPDPSYSFRITDLPVGNSRTINLGETVEAVSTDLSTMDVYQFEIPEAGAVYVEPIAGMGCEPPGHVWAIYDAEGVFIKSGRLGTYCNLIWEPKAIALPRAGVYTLAVVHGIYPEPYAFRVHASSLQLHPIEIGTEIIPDPQSGRGILEGLGAADIYAFTGVAGQQVYFYGRVSPDDANVLFVVRGATGGFGIEGTFGANEFPRNSRLYTLPQSGTFRVLISSPTDAIGEYAFKLLPSIGAQKLIHELGTTVDETSAPGGYLDGNGAKDEFTFTVAEPGAIIELVDLGSEGSNMTWTLQEVAPWMTWPSFIEPLDGVSDVEGVLSFYYPGTYRITVEAKDGDPDVIGLYSFKSIVHNRPVAVGDGNLKTKRGKTVRIPKGRLLANDYDADGHEITWFGMSSDPSLLNGTVSDEGDTLLFTPNTGYTGFAEFTYQIEDSYGLRSFPAVVRITVE